MFFTPGPDQPQRILSLFSGINETRAFDVVHSLLTSVVTIGNQGGTKKGGESLR